MNKPKQLKSICAGKYRAEVSVSEESIGELLGTDERWSPYLSLQDAYKSDDIREAHINKDFEKENSLNNLIDIKRRKNDK